MDFVRGLLNNMIPEEPTTYQPPEGSDGQKSKRHLFGYSLIITQQGSS